MNPRIDPLIARIALSLYTSDKRTERLPRVTEVQRWEYADIQRDGQNAAAGASLAARGITRYEGI